MDDYVTSVTTPATATATASTDGRTYRVVRGNNQPDEVLPFTYVTTFAVTLTTEGSAEAKGSLVVAGQGALVRDLSSQCLRHCQTPLMGRAKIRQRM